jgi:hypothetical protein
MGRTRPRGGSRLPKRAARADQVTQRFARPGYKWHEDGSRILPAFSVDEPPGQVSVRLNHERIGFGRPSGDSSCSCGSNGTSRMRRAPWTAGGLPACVCFGPLSCTFPNYRVRPSAPSFRLRASACSISLPFRRRGLPLGKRRWRDWARRSVAAKGLHREFSRP